jgi:hypothetical protein
VKALFISLKVIGYGLLIFTIIVSLYVIINDIYILMNEPIIYYFGYFLGIFILHLPSILLIKYANNKLKNL